MKASILLLNAVGWHFCKAQTLESVVDSARSDIASLIQSSSELGPKFLRLSFHDAVGGGSDGCVDMDDPDNAGLEIPIEALEPIVDRYSTESTGLSRADLWVLAAMVACEVSQNKLSFPMAHFGRVDCDDPGSDADCTDLNGNARNCSSTTGPPATLPLPDLTTSELLHFFSQEFGFTPQETVAIMGAHTLGEASRQNSGFDGSNGWVDDNDELDNEYYRLLVGGDGPGDSLDELVNDAPGWDDNLIENNDLAGIPDRAVWTRRARTGGTPLIMMNADIAIVRDVEGFLEDDNQSSCQFTRRRNGGGTVCPHAAATLQFAAAYRFDEDLWLHDFRNVMTKMTTFGYEIGDDCNGGVCLQLVGSDAPTRSPAASTTEGLGSFNEESASALLPSSGFVTLALLSLWGSWLAHM